MTQKAWWLSKDHTSFIMFCFFHFLIQYYNVQYLARNGVWWLLLVLLREGYREKLKFYYILFKSRLIPAIAYYPSLSESNAGHPDGSSITTGGSWAPKAQDISKFWKIWSQHFRAFSYTSVVEILYIYSMRLRLCLQFVFGSGIWTQMLVFHKWGFFTTVAGRGFRVQIRVGPLGDYNYHNALPVS